MALAVLCCSSSLFASIQSASFSGSALTGVVVDGRTINESDLIGVTLTAFNGATSVLITDNGASIPGVGNRSSLLSDNLVTTGVINQDAGTMTATIVFVTPVINQSGDDIVWFEINTDGSTAVGDTFNVTINGVTQLVGSQFKARTAAQQPDMDLFASTDGAVNSLANLESFNFNKTSDINQALFAYSIDLSDFGVALGDSITTMHYGSSGVTADPTYFAGIPEVPEPASIVTLAGLTFCFGAGGWYRRRRAKAAA